MPVDRQGADDANRNHNDMIYPSPDHTSDFRPSARESARIDAGSKAVSGSSTFVPWQCLWTCFLQASHVCVLQPPLERGCRLSRTVVRSTFLIPSALQKAMPQYFQEADKTTNKRECWMAPMRDEGTRRGGEGKTPVTTACRESRSG